MSVFDPYTYWKLYLYFEKHGLLNSLLEGEPVTENDFLAAVKANKDLNLNKDIDTKITLLRGLFSGGIRLQVF